MPDEKREGGPPPSTLLVVDAVIEPSVESEWNEWYDGTHLPEILACPHFQSGVRYISDAGGVRNISRSTLFFRGSGKNSGIREGARLGALQRESPLLDAHLRSIGKPA
jgi:hypothetical protein